MEYGQIYGSYRRDLIPVEVGMVIWDEMSAPLFKSRKFYADCDLVMRKNIVDRSGNTVGVAERVANSVRKEHNKPYDPEFKLEEEARQNMKRKTAYNTFGLLNQYIHEAFNEYQPSTLVFFSKSQDLFIFKKARVDVSGHQILDMQEEIMRSLDTKTTHSLDKISKLIGFKTNWRYIRSDHFTYGVPMDCRNFVKPHKAVGDAARIFLLYKEFYEKNDEFMERVISLKPGEREL